MLVPLRDLTHSVEALGAISRLDLSIVPSFRVSKIVVAVNEHLTEYYAACDKEIKRQAAASGDVKPDQAALQRELDKLGDVKVEVPGGCMALSDFTGLAIKPLHLVALRWLIVEDALIEQPAPEVPV